MAMLSIVYFAWVREAIGRDEEQIERLDPGRTVGDLVAMLAARGGSYAEALGDSMRHSFGVSRLQSWPVWAQGNEARFDPFCGPSLHMMPRAEYPEVAK